MNEGAGRSPGHSDGAHAGKHELTVELGGTESNCGWPVLTPFLLEPAARARRKGGFCTLQASYTAPTATAAIEGGCFSSTAALLTGPISVAAVFEYS